MVKRCESWIAAEAALEESCQRAVDNGFTLVHDIYGVRVNWEQKYVASLTKTVCVSGSYLLDRDSAGSYYSPGSDVAQHLGVQRDWVGYMEVGFSDLPLPKDYWQKMKDYEQDGYETGCRLREKFKPKKWSTTAGLLDRRTTEDRQLETTDV